VTAGETAINDALIGALDALAATAAAVYLRDPERPVLRLAGARSTNAGDAPAWAAEVAWGKGVPGGAAAAGEPVSGVEHDRSTLAAPLLLGDDAIGSLAVVSDVARDFGDADAEAVLARSRALARALARTPLEALRTELAGRIQASASQWLDTITATAARGEREAIVTSFPAVGRRLGREPLGSRSALVRPDFDLEVPLRGWRIDDAGRVALLCAFAGDAEALARELYFTGDLRERCGALRGLAMLGRSRVGVDCVLDACRTSSVELFEAAMADNPYACRFLPEEEFRNAVLKAAFMGVAISRLPGIEARASAELSRMLLSYVTEREVAGRSVPADIWPVAALHPTPGLVGKLCGYLEHPAEAHRAAAALALGRIGDRRVQPFVRDRLAREDDRAVRRALERALA
jgi:HEAT repeats/GAF domain